MLRSADGSIAPWRAIGLVGIGLLAVPGATGSFFSWQLEPEALAAFAGGVYVGSAVAYAAAVLRPEPYVRPLVAAAVVLSLSVLAASLAHRDVFDFDRLQAWAWFSLVAGFGAITTALVVGGLAIALWVDPVDVGKAGPFELPPLGGRFAGAWLALLAVAAGWVVVRDRAQEAWLAALALIAVPAGALLGALRTLPDLSSSGAAAAYIVALLLLMATGVAVLRASASVAPDAPG